MRSPILRRGLTALLVLLFLAGGSVLTAQDGAIDEDALFGGSGDSGADSSGADSSSDSGNLDDDLFGGSEDDLFGSSDNMVEELPEPGQGSEDGQSDAYLEFLTSDEVQIGGRLNSSLSSNWIWADAWDGDFDVTDNNDVLGISLGGSVYINARPSSDLRIYMRANTAYPFDTNSEIFEFYSDVNWDQNVFFRFGKQTVNWGVGYFYSPADFISLVPIDIDDPEADREGPVAIKVSVPFGLNGFEAYLIGDESVRELQDLGVAGRATLFFNPVEVAFGAGYQRDRPFRIMSTVRMPWRDWNLFAEGRVSWGREGKQITDLGIYNPLTSSWVTDPTYEEDNSVYVSATAGFLYTKSELFETDLGLNVIGQYFYNAEGYADTDLYGNPLFMLAYSNGVTNGEVSPGLVANLGQHYTVLSVGLSQLFVEDLSWSNLWQANWTDFSGMVNSSLSYRLFDGMSVSAGLIGSYGDDPGEFSSVGGLPTMRNPFGDMAATVTLNLGGGRF